MPEPSQRKARSLLRSRKHILTLLQQSGHSVFPEWGWIWPITANGAACDARKVARLTQAERAEQAGIGLTAGQP
jgi:hypothetical protein